VAESEALGGAEGVLEAVSFKEPTESMDRGRVANARWDCVPDSGGGSTKIFIIYLFLKHFLAFALTYISESLFQ